MYCPNCGKQIADESLFCMYCGKATPTIGATTVAAPETKLLNSNPAVQMKLNCWPRGNVVANKNAGFSWICRSLWVWIRLLDTDNNHTPSNGRFTMLVTGSIPNSRPLMFKNASNAASIVSIKEKENIKSYLDVSAFNILGQSDIHFELRNKVVAKEDFAEKSLIWNTTQAEENVIRYHINVPNMICVRDTSSMSPTVHLWFSRPKVGCYTLTTPLTAGEYHDALALFLQKRKQPQRSGKENLNHVTSTNQPKRQRCR